MKELFNKPFWLSFVSRLIGVAVIVVVSVILIKVSKVFIDKLLLKNQSNLTDRKRKTLSSILHSVTRYIIYFFMIYQILALFISNMGSILAVAGIGSVAIGLGAQGLVRDVLAGVFILFEDQYGVGDVITIMEQSGVVENIGLRTTRIRSADGNVHIIPNGSIGFVTNMSKDFNRAVVDLLVTQEADIPSVIEIINDEINSIHPNIKGLFNKPTVLGVQNQHESTITIRISADCEVGTNWQAERELRKKLIVRLKKEGIPLPYTHIKLNEA